MIEEKTTTQLKDALLRALLGQNFSGKTVRAYGKDLQQFLEWVRSVRIDAELPARMAREDVEGFMHHLGTLRLTGVSRARKLAAIRKFFAFLVESGHMRVNPTATVRGARREEREPEILYKEQYKALLYEASDNL